LAASFYLVHEIDRKWRSVSIDTVGEGLGIWFPGNVSDLFYWKIGRIDVLRRYCSGKITFSFSPQFIKQFYNYVWDSEFCCGKEDLSAVWFLPKCVYGKDEIDSLVEKYACFKEFEDVDQDLCVQVWRSCVELPSSLLPSRRDLEGELFIDPWLGVKVCDAFWPISTVPLEFRTVSWVNFLENQLSVEMEDALIRLWHDLFAWWKEASKLVHMGCSERCKYLVGAAFKLCGPEDFDVSCESDAILTPYEKLTSF
jgi:hypothetical protein